MLPDFPSTKRNIGERILASIEALARQKAPIIGEIQVRMQHEGRTHSFDRIGAPPKAQGYEAVMIPVTIQISEVPDLKGPHMAKKIDEIAEQRARMSMKLFDRRFKETTEEVGTAFNAQGASLDEEFVLKMLASVEMEFSPDGQPLGRFDTTPEIGEKLQEIEKSPSFAARYRELVERKRAAWLDRESRRKLVD